MAAIAKPARAVGIGAIDFQSRVGIARVKSRVYIQIMQIARICDDRSLCINCHGTNEEPTHRGKAERKSNPTVAAMYWRTHEGLPSPVYPSRAEPSRIFIDRNKSLSIDNLQTLQKAFIFSREGMVRAEGLASAFLGSLGNFDGLLILVLMRQARDKFNRKSHRVGIIEAECLCSINFITSSIWVCASSIFPGR